MRHRDFAIAMLLISLLALLALPVQAQDFQKGVKAYERGDYATAQRKFRLVAEQEENAVGALYNLGQLYRKSGGIGGLENDGRGVSK